MAIDIELTDVKYHSQVMLKLIQENNFKKIAEIGVYKAKSAKNVLRYCHNEIDEYWGIDEYKDWYCMYWGACRAMPFFPKFRILKMESGEAANLFYNYLRYTKEKGYFDLVFIDANHSYKMVKRDILLWRPLVKKDGIISGHDYGFANRPCRYPGVQKAVDEIFGTDVLVNRIAGAWWKVLN